jgi:hypothetical protein
MNIVYNRVIKQIAISPYQVEHTTSVDLIACILFSNNIFYSTDNNMYTANTIINTNIYINKFEDFFVCSTDFVCCTGATTFAGYICEISIFQELPVAWEALGHQKNPF